MISEAARITTNALRARWSTVAMLAGILSIGRAVQEWPLAQSDIGAYLAKLLVTIIISTITSLIIHVVIYLIFTPREARALEHELTDESKIKNPFAQPKKSKGRAARKKK